MADPVLFPEANIRLLPPSGHESEVREMIAHRADDGRIVSCWRLSIEDLRRVAETGEVWISVWTAAAPPPVLVFGLKEDVL